MTYIEAVKFTPSKEFKALALASFGYKGRIWKTQPRESYHPTNYWDGGSRNYFVAVAREGMKVAMPKADTNNPFKALAHGSFPIPVGFIIMEHVISCGKDRGIRIYYNPLDTDPTIEAGS
jgi:hypothetical protein